MKRRDFLLAAFSAAVLALPMRAAVAQMQVLKERLINGFGCADVAA